MSGAWTRDTPEGPWWKEPDFALWMHQDIACVVMRPRGMMHLCGYIGLQPGHPLNKVDWDAIPDAIYTPHGGVTYSDSTLPNVDLSTFGWTWFLGFDAHHHCDLNPSLPQYGGEYRTFAYMRAEVERFAESVARWAGPEDPRITAFLKMITDNVRNIRREDAAAIEKRLEPYFPPC